MRESVFIEKNYNKWKNYETLLGQASTNPDTLLEIYNQLASDLSYAKTFFPNRSIKIYLNRLTAKAYLKINKHKTNFFQQVKQFYTTDIPQIIYSARKELWFSFAILVLSVIIGAFSTAKDENFARTILSDEYVEMTISNIKKGDPMGVYKHQNQLDMFSYIAKNNLQVSLFIFVFGIFVSYGSVFMLIRNGIMLGTFMYFFYSRGQSAEFNYTVWLHGTIEILSLVVCTTAGILLGKGLLYPGTLPRVKAFSVYGKQGGLLLLAIVPLIIFAAFIESFITRHTELPNIIRIVLILISAIFMVYYFVILPYKKFKNTPINWEEYWQFDSSPQKKFEQSKIYSIAEILHFFISFFVRNIKLILIGCISIVAVFLITLKLIHPANYVYQYKIIEFDYLVLLTEQKQYLLKYLIENITYFFITNHKDIPIYLKVLWLGFTFLFIVTLLRFKIESKKINLVKSILLCFIVAALIQFGIHYLQIHLVIILGIIMPLACLLLIKWHLSNFESLNTFQVVILLLKSYRTLISIILVWILIFILTLLLSISSFSYLFIEILSIHIQATSTEFTQLLNFGFIGIFLFTLVLNIFFLTILLTLAGYSLYERNTANGLINSINKIGKKTTIYGLEKE